MVCHLVGVSQGEQRLALQPWNEVVVVVPRSHKKKKVKRQY